MKTYIIFVISVFCALVLSILPLPHWAVWFRPEWVAMVMIYWVIALPRRVNVGAAWLVGLFVDALSGKVLGEHALLLMLLVYVVSLLQRKLCVLPLWQQSLAVLVLLWFYQGGTYLLQFITGEPPETFAYFGAAITSLLFWPWVYVLLRDSQRRFGIA